MPDRIYRPRGTTEEELAAEVDRLEVEREARGRGLVPVPPDVADDRVLPLNGVPAYAVRRVRDARPPSLEARVLGSAAARFDPPVRHYRLEPYGSAHLRPSRTRRLVPPGAGPRGEVVHEVAEDEPEPVWTTPWAEHLLRLRRADVLGDGPLVWALRRANADPEWAEALLATVALALDGGMTTGPVVALVRDGMEAEGYCFRCGRRSSAPRDCSCASTRRDFYYRQLVAETDLEGGS